jgi:hypothetical protein
MMQVHFATQQADYQTFAILNSNQTIVQVNLQMESTVSKNLLLYQIFYREDLLKVQFKLIINGALLSMATYVYLIIQIHKQEFTVKHRMDSIALEIMVPIVIQLQVIYVLQVMVLT